MKSKTGHTIKKRENSNDVFITPLGLSKLHIDMIDDKWNSSIWLDPCRNNGSYYNQFPLDSKREYCEILDGIDFFSFNKSIDVICGNPPYSILDKWIDKSIELNPNVISYLIGQGALTTRRIEKMEKAGYGLKKLHFTKVFEWYGMSYIVVFEKGTSSIIQYDRKVWRDK